MKATRRPHNFIDLTGDTFGKWTVLSRAPQAPGRQAKWLCRCECGREQAVQSQDLRVGQSTQCRSCAFAGPDITGQTFGKWTVLERAESDGAGAHWRVECACGAKRVLTGSTLRNGESKQCMECAHSNRSTDDELRYSTMHMRLRTERGPASDCLCAMCGEQARDWAYLHNGAHEERWDVISSWRGEWRSVPFSPNQSHYVPLCRSCHARYDKSPWLHELDRRITNLEENS